MDIIVSGIVFVSLVVCSILTAMSIIVYSFVYLELETMVVVIAREHCIELSKWTTHLIVVLGIIIASIPPGVNLWRAFKMMDKHCVKFHV